MMRKSCMLARLHSYPAIQANYLAVEHLVLDDVFCQSRVLIGTAQARWERHLLTQREAGRVRQTRGEQPMRKTRRKGQHPNVLTMKLTGAGERRTNNTTL